LGYRRIGALLLPDVLLALGISPAPRRRQLTAEATTAP
jgi:hypothetical protein